MEYNLAIKPENSAIGDNMDGPWRHYAKWNKSDRERQILYDLTYMWNLKQKSRFTEKEIRFVTTRSWAWGEGLGEQKVIG